MPKQSILIRLQEVRVFHGFERSLRNVGENYRSLSARRTEFVGGAWRRAFRANPIWIRNIGQLAVHVWDSRRKRVADVASRFG